MSPNSPSVAQGGSVTLTLTFTSQNGFQGTVSLSVTKDGQEPSWLTLSPASKSLNVPKGGQAQETLQLQVAGNAPTGPHALKLRATYGDKTAERDLTLTVNPPPSFALSLNPTSLSVQQGDSAQTALTLTPQNGFTGTVSLSLVAGQDGVPQGLSLSPQSVQVTGSSPVNQTLTLSASASTPTGTYRLRVRGTSGSLTQEAALTVTVSAPSGGGGGGGGGNTGSVNTPGGQVQLVLQGGTFTQGPTAQNVPPPQGFQAPYGAIAFTAQVPQGGTLTVTLTFPNPIPQGAVLKKYQGNAWQDVPGAQLSGNTATYQVQDGGPLDGDGQQNGQVVDPVALLTPAPSYTLSLSPTSLTVQQGGQGQVTVSLARQNFTGDVTLSLEGSNLLATSPAPDKIAWSFSPNPATGDQATLTLQVGQSVTAGDYALTVRGQAQGLQDQTATLSLRVQPQPSFDFSLDRSSVVTRRDPNYQGNNRIHLTFTTQNGFQGQVDLSLVDEGGNPVQGLSLSPTSLNVTGNGQGFYVYVLADDTLPLSGAGKGYPVRVRARSGNLVREQPLTVDVWTGVGVADLNFARVAYGNGIFVVAGADGYTGYSRVYVYNPQDDSFNKTFEDNTLCGWPRDVAYDPDHQTWVVVGYLSGLIMVSADNAQTWQIVYGARNPDYPSCSAQYGDGMPLHRVRYVNDRLWAWSEAWNSQRLYFSQDGGYNWNFVPLPIPQGYVNLQIKGLTFGQGKYVAVGVLFDSGSRAYPMLATSTDGSNWNVTPFTTPQTPWGAGTPSDVLYVPDWDTFVMVGGLGLLGTSPDGMNWDFRNFYNPYDYNQDVGHLTGLAYGNGAVVAGSWSGPKVLVSTDDQNWRIVDTNCGASAMSVAFGGGIFAHTSAGAPCTSP
ncbi:choice-of-anchor U domain-containing protein [Thermus tengchongensis]|uniref:choice-of-anchor U domain-containing protein n=1 Tax=Thermus tengchongensis TaxID=1214928 RepID=UPI00163AFD91|nr:choice-of-anchor U domain-containing protein [Thermus tengchongensis]